MSPEASELVAMYLYLVWLLRHRLGLFSEDNELALHEYRSAAIGWLLLGIWIDPTEEEVRKALSKSPSARNSRQQRIAEYLPFRVEPGDKYKRGSNQGSALCWPLRFASLDGFRFVNVQLTPRVIIFDFTVCRLHMHFGLHTSIQVMTRETWQDELQETPAKIPLGIDRAKNKLKSRPGTRKAKIAMALEFDEYVVAFVSKDMICTPLWSVEPIDYPPEVYPGFDTTCDPLPSPLAFYQWFVGVLNAEWTKSIDCEFGRTHLAIDWVRSSSLSKHACPGTGAYTGCEDFTFAGIWAGLTIAEVFMCPSRAARVVEALYTIMWRAKDQFFSSVVRPAMHSGIMISPTEQQRLDFFHRYIHVWHKDRAFVHQRHAVLIKKVQLSIDVTGGSDIDAFEPTMIEPSFRKYIHTAGIIFGDDLPAGIKPSVCEDPLTTFYRSKGLLGAPTHLPSYSPTFIPENEFRSPSNRRYVRTYAYKSKGMVWSVLPPPERLREAVLAESDKESSIFTHTIKKTQDVVIGPLEFYGNAINVFTGRSHVIVTNKTAAARAGYHQIRHLRTEARKKLGYLDAKGKRKVALTNAQHAAIESHVQRRCEDMGIDYDEYLLVADDPGQDLELDSEEAPQLVEERAPKRRRRADLQLIADAAPTSLRASRTRGHDILTDISNVAQ